MERLGQGIQTVLSFYLVLLLLMQFLGKSVIKKLYPLFHALQILLTIGSYTQILLPQNVISVIQGTDGILKLDAFPKEKVKNWALSRVGISLICLLVGVIILGLVIMALFCKKRFSALFTTVKRLVFSFA